MSSSIGGRWAWPLFLVLAYGITWAVQVPAYLHLVPRGIAPTNETNFLVLGTGGGEPGTILAVVLLCFSFGPSVAGVVVTALEAGRPGLRSLFARLFKARIPGKWILFVLLFPIVLSVAALTSVTGATLGQAPLRTVGARQFIDSFIDPRGARVAGRSWVSIPTVSAASHPTSQRESRAYGGGIRTRITGMPAEPFRVFAYERPSQ